MDSLLAAREDAERGIVRCDGRLVEALRPGSPLAPFVPLYIHQRRAFALLAARHAARIAREEQQLCER